MLGRIGDGLVVFVASVSLVRLVTGHELNPGYVGLVLLGLIIEYAGRAFGLRDN